MANLIVSRVTQILMIVRKIVEPNMSGKWLQGVEKL